MILSINILENLQRNMSIITISLIRSVRHAEANKASRVVCCCICYFIVYYFGIINSSSEVSVR